MPRLSNSLPKYRKHRTSGQAVVTLHGRDLYLGPYNTKASKIESIVMLETWGWEAACAILGRTTAMLKSHRL
jgi:hypothetical protein